MFSFTFFASEDVSLMLVVVGSVLGSYLSRRHLALHRRVTTGFVGAGMLMWGALVVTGVFRPSHSPSDEMHGWLGHLLLPTVAVPIGLWIGGSGVVAQTPLRFLTRLLALFFLAFCCFSNARTGYFGVADADSPDGLRFDVMHRVTAPCYIGIALAIWLLRLRAQAAELARNRSA
ncbi:MAG TPA: hypothetical protein VFE62_23060 [Gemmataceae bacterium]|nr:hypothetical protein [Gemmataceae bacterium]